MLILIWLLHTFIIALISWQGSRKVDISGMKTYYWAGLALKIVAGIVLGIVYKFYYYGGDTWGFFEHADRLSSIALADPLKYLRVLITGAAAENLSLEIGYSDQPRAFLMVRILSVPVLLTGGSYWLSCIYLSLFSFFGLWALTTQVVKKYSDAKTAALAAFIFLPSTCLWSSGISKETIFLGGFGFIVSWFWPYFDQDRISIKNWFFAAILLILLVPLKYYYAAVLLPVLVATAIHYRLSGVFNHRLSGPLGWLLIFGVLIGLASFLHPNLSLTYVTQVMQDNAQRITTISGTDSLITLIDHTDSRIWAVINLPVAVFTGLFRPNLGDWGNWLQNLAVVENAIITLFAITRLTSVNEADLKHQHCFPCLIYVIVMATMLTLSTPNFGTLVRFKAAFLPVFVFMVLYRNNLWQRLTLKLP